MPSNFPTSSPKTLGYFTSSFCLVKYSMCRSSMAYTGVLFVCGFFNLSLSLYCIMFMSKHAFQPKIGRHNRSCHILCLVLDLSVLVCDGIFCFFLEGMLSALGLPLYISDPGMFPTLFIWASMLSEARQISSVLIRVKICFS